MIKATTLILEDSDFTPDSNLRKEAFEALSDAEVVIHNVRVIKNSHTGLTTQAPARKRAPRASNNAPRTENPPQDPNAPAEPTPLLGGGTHTPRTRAELPQTEQLPPADQPGD